MEKITFEDIKNANESIITIDVKGKEYSAVNERIKAFRMNHPLGTIATNIESLQNGVVVMSCEVKDEEGNLLGKAFAYEKENSTFINKTSFIENCCTSATGRALGYAGYGIDLSVASAEEVQNAINNQITINTPEEARALKLTFGKYTGRTIGELVDEKSSYIDYLFQNGTPDIKQAITILTGMVEMTNEEAVEKIKEEFMITEVQKQQIKDLDKELIKSYLIERNKKKISELTYEEANALLEKNEIKGE